MRFSLYGILFFLLLVTSQLRADIVYPARLDLTEVRSNIWEVSFSLPVINGNVLKAEPLLPHPCKDISDQVVTGDAYRKITSWQISCPAELLAGERIGIEGLLGSPVDVMLSIRYLDGRVHSTRLGPSNAFYVIPNPPTAIELSKEGLLTGTRYPLSRIYLFLLWAVLLTVFGKSFTRQSLLAQILGLSTGYVLSINGWILIPGYFALLVCLGIVIWLILADIKTKNYLASASPMLLLMGLTGLALGSTPYPEDAFTLYTPGEALQLHFWTIAGMSVGLILIFLTMRELMYLAEFLRKKFYLTTWLIRQALAIAATAWFLYELTWFWTMPSAVPTLPSLIWIWLAGQGVMTIKAGKSSPTHMSLFLGMIIAAGLVTGLTIPLTTHYQAILSITLTALLILTAFGREYSPSATQAMQYVVTFFAGTYLGSYAEENLSLAFPNSIGHLILILTLLTWLGLATKYRTNEKIVQPHILAGLAALLATLIFILHLANHFTVYVPEWEADRTLGLLRIPILSLVLLLLGIIFWPGRRKIHRTMGLAKRKPVFSLILLASAFLLLPYANVKATNPLFEPRPLTREEARNALNQALGNTYTAFNLPIEKEAYERLSQSVEEGLIDDIYLDSRRRLHAGVREGAQVSVQDVKVTKVGEQLSTTANAREAKYAVVWVVVARVEHLEHIHYRQNQYTGNITIKRDENQWKLSEIALTSENRTILKNASG